MNNPATRARPRARRRSPLPWMVAIVAAVGIAGATGVIRGANARTAGIERVDGLDGVLATADGQPLLDASGNTIDLDEPVDYPAENYLLVGSDSREGFSDEAFIGSEGDVAGNRSDTIMILHQERNGGASLMSVPRDLWVPIYGTDDNDRVNAAFNDGPLALVATVSESLEIPIHHYVEVDFVGFKNIIDRIGGVELCVDLAARDTHSGLALQPGCQTLDGAMALAFARSRFYETWDGEDWVTDGRADLGRIERQQLFLRTAINGALHKLQSSPFSAGDTIQAVVDSVKIDGGLDPLHAAQVLGQAFQDGVRTFALPVYNDTVGDAAVLRLGDSAEPLLAYFRGTGPAPTEFETTATTGGATPTTVPVGATTVP